MRKLTILAVCYLAVLSCLSAQQQKKRVAIIDFDYATVHSSVSAIWGTNVDVGKGICDLLVEKLVSGAVYSVIERRALDRILAEQNFSNSDRANPATAAKIGKILGVDAIVMGSITQFGRDDKNTSVGGFGAVTGRFGIGGVGRREAKAVVDISARLIDTDTAEILAVAHGKGESKRSGTTLLGAGGGGGAAGGGAMDMSSKNFASTILGEAVYQAVGQCAQELEAGAGNLPLKVRQIEGLVADASGGTLILNIGTNAGVKVGDRYQVRRAVREVKDPATGRVLRTISNLIGEVMITEADEVSSVGTFSGSTPAKIGDAVSNAK
jgi:curli biogenesis system outer membrane secretion channel CsgG